MYKEKVLREGSLVWPQDTDTFYLLELLSFIREKLKRMSRRVPRIISRVVIRRVPFRDPTLLSFSRERNNRWYFRGPLLSVIHHQREAAIAAAELISGTLISRSKEEFVIPVA